MTIRASRYGTIPYGLYKYGSTGTETTPTYLWALEVDWDGDGVFDGSNEAGRMTDIDITRGRKTFLQPNGQGFYPIQPGNAKITLDNHDGRYDAWNSSSPLYPDVTYGKDVRLKAIDAATGSTYSVFYGVLSDIIPLGYGSTAYVKLYVEDQLKYLLNTTPLYGSRASTNTVAGDAITSILSYAGWSSRWGQSIDTSTSNVINYFWVRNSENASNQCSDVSNSFLGYFFVSASGSARYIDRTTTGTDQILYTEDIIQKDIGLPQPWNNYRSISSIAGYISISSTSFYASTSLTFSYAVAASTDTRVYANNLYSFGIKNNSTPDSTSSTDFQNWRQIASNSTNNPDNTDIFAFYYYSTGTSVLPSSSYVTKLSRMHAEGVYVFFQHNDTSTDPIYLSVGSAGYPIQQTPYLVKYPNTTSTTNERGFLLNSFWIQDVNTARSLVSVIGALLSQQNKYPVIQINNRPSYQFPDLFTRVNLDVPTLGISTESFRVGGIEHIGTPQDLKTTLWLEKYIST